MLLLRRTLVRQYLQHQVSNVKRKTSNCNNQFFTFHFSLFTSFHFSSFTLRLTPYTLHLIIALLLFASNASAQTDKQNLSKTSVFNNTSDTAKPAVKPAPVKVTKPPKEKVVIEIDSATGKRKHRAQEATRRSLILPGWGQAYNKEYWKIPLVYGALAIPTITYFYNDDFYKKTKFAYEARYKAATLEPGATKRDSTDYNTLEPRFKTADISAIQSVRNASRRDRDYSILWFFILWGVNVADATVFGHLKGFNVSSDLSMQVKPTFNPVTKGPGLSIVVNMKKAEHKMSSVGR